MQDLCPGVSASIRHTSVGSQAVMAHPACPLQQATQPASYRAKAATLARAPVSRAVKPTTPAAKTPVLANRQVLGADKSTALQDHTCAITVNAINATAQQCGAASANVQHGKLSGNVEVSAKCHAARVVVALVSSSASTFACCQMLSLN